MNGYRLPLFISNTLGRHKQENMEKKDLKALAFELAVKSMSISIAPDSRPTSDEVRTEAEKIYQWLLKD